MKTTAIEYMIEYAEEFIDDSETYKLGKEARAELQAMKAQLAAKDAAIIKMREEVAHNSGVRNEYQDFEEFFELAEVALKESEQE